MAQPLLRNIIDAMKHYYLTLRTLKGLTPRLTHSGEMRFCSGRRSIIFDVDTPEGHYALKCYTSTPEGAQELFDTIVSLHTELIVAPQFLPSELYVSGGTYEGYIDLLLTPWAEGDTLDYELRRAAFNRESDTLGRLAEEFRRLSLEILSSPWRHGDLKPDNIIVAPNGKMRLIDLDGLYHPSLPSRGECGTPGYIHPSRGEGYDSHIDDYSIALICTSLHSLALKPDLLDLYPSNALLINPTEAINGQSRCLDEIKQLFATNSSLHALATTLSQPHYQITNLKEILECIAHPSPANTKGQ